MVTMIVFYLLIAACVAFAWMAYRKQKAIHRYTSAEFADWECIMANDLSVVFAATISLVLIAVLIVTLSPGNEELKEQRQAKEQQVYRALGRQLAMRLVPHVQNQDRVLVIDRRDGDQGQLYHKARLAGVEEIFAMSRVEVELVDPPGAVAGASTIEGPAPRNLKLDLTTEDLEIWADQHRDCRVIISFVDLPIRFWQDADVALLVDEAYRGERVIALYTSNVYNLGPLVSDEVICGVAVPKYVTKPHLTSKADNLEGLFNHRFWYTNPAGAVGFAQKNKNLFNWSIWQEAFDQPEPVPEPGP